MNRIIATLALAAVALVGGPVAAHAGPGPQPVPTPTTCAGHPEVDTMTACWLVMRSGGKARPVAKAHKARHHHSSGYGFECPLCRPVRPAW